MSNIAFSSSANYMKRSIYVGNTPLTLTGYNGTVSTVIAHNLGYIPYYDVFVDFSNDGTIWGNEKINSMTESSLYGDYPDPILRTWIDNNNLTIELINQTSPLATGTRTVYWIIYLDYGNK